MKNLRAITIRQPWASAIMDELKGGEVRSWVPSFDLPEIVVIHSSAGPVYRGPSCLPRGYADRVFLRGYVLGCAVLERIVPMPDLETFLSFQEVHRCDRSYFRPGLFLWVWGRVFPLSEPVRFRGRLRFWDIEFKESE